MRSVRRATLLSWVAWAVGLAVVAVLIHQIGVAPVLGALTAAGPRIVWLMAAYSVATVVMAIPWRLLLTGLQRPSVGGAVASRFAASGLNAVLPFITAGDAVRLLWLDRGQWPQGAAAVVVDRLMFAVASVAFIGLGAIAIALMPSVPRAFEWAALGAALITALLVAVFVWLAGRGKTVSLLHRFVRRLSARLLPASGDGAQPSDLPALIDGALQSLLLRARGKLGAIVLIHLFGRCLAAVEIYAGLRALNVPVTPAPVLILAAVPVALNLVGAFMPGQIGLQEGACTAVAAALGLGATTGLSLVLLIRIRQLLFVPVTAAVLSFRVHHPTPTGADRAPPP